MPYTLKDTVNNIYFGSGVLVGKNEFANRSLVGNSILLNSLFTAPSAILPGLGITKTSSILV